MKNPQQELSEIKSIMERSKRFLSLSGIAGIPVGIAALLGMALINYTINQSWKYWLLPDEINLKNAQILSIILIASITFLTSAGITWVLSQRKSQGIEIKKLWTPASKKFIQSLTFPILVGAAICIILVMDQTYQLLAGMSLSFYGLGMFQASDYSFKELRLLGIGCVLLGIFALYLPSLGLILWAVGFGVFHIIYGILMHLKYDR